MMMKVDPTRKELDRPVILAGPCLAESYSMLQESALFLQGLAQRLDFDFYFKASFDKANRSSAHSVRGSGMDSTLTWFADLKQQLGVKILTDVHETYQVAPTSSVVDMLQIPAFLCRQSDLVMAAGRTHCDINIKKGQFMAPGGMEAIAEKARLSKAEAGARGTVFLTERGACFGYGDLVVDMRSLAVMESPRTPVLYDMTHSVQKPPLGEGSMVSRATRNFIPLLARAAAATGCLTGFFLESHPDPKNACSDKDSQLNFEQTERLLTQLIPLLKESRRQRRELDPLFL
jgi:2-dehydro-3-deoxyphosphooctonate aldolase (KDO 8-P synthase)